jgi:fructose-bisphosphate aldolase class I
MLRQARVPVSEDNLRRFADLVLGAPGLERMVSGVLVDGGTLRRVAAGDADLPPLLTERRVPVGVRMGDETDHRLDIAGSTDEAAAEVARYVAAGADFARWRIVVGEGTAAAEVRARARLVAQWAALCQAAGIAPFVDCVVVRRGHHGLGDAERAHTEAVGIVIGALDAADVDLANTLLGSSLVVPGARSSEAATAEDIARATLRSLRNAGAKHVAGIAFTPTGKPGRLTAHLAAMQWLSPDWPIGFCLGRSMLTRIARVWRGRPENVADAQAELHNRLNSAQAVLRAGLNEVDRRGGVAWWDNGSRRGVLRAAG